MDAYEIEIAKWLEANGVLGDARAAKAIYSALNQPGHYGAIEVAREGASFVVTGPAGQLTVTGSNDIQALRLRLEEIINHPGRPAT